MDSSKLFLEVYPSFLTYEPLILTPYSRSLSFS
jgi:hypothetical protein